MIRGRRAARWTAALVLLASAGCGSEREATPPNVLWIVWDTVRADHMSVYGYGRPTTPFLERWAQGARVFDDCRSVGSSTVPAHGSMFTGLYPSEHGANNRTRFLDDRFTTVAELFRDAGYATYLYSANPNIQVRENFQQGFQVEEHPWDPERREAALAILGTKAEGDLATGLPRILAGGEVDDVHLKACGALAAEALLGFLDDRGSDRPYFAFLNYMEAHEPLVPPRELREVFLDPDQVEASYRLDRSWRSGWQYTLRPAPPGRGLLRGPARGLRRGFARARRPAGGPLDAARGARVPGGHDRGPDLGPRRAPGGPRHRGAPVLAVRRSPARAVDPPRSGAPGARTLGGAGDEPRPVPAPCRPWPALSRRGAGPRPPPTCATCPPTGSAWRSIPGTFRSTASAKGALAPGLRPGALEATPAGLPARGDDKLIWASDGGHELYATGADPRETSDRAQAEPAALEAMLLGLEALRRSLVPFTPSGRAPGLSAEFQRQLEAIGY